MSFSNNQLRKLAGKLPERYVKTRSQRGISLSYVEGWHVIDEANRVFGFDAWDRETLSADCVYQDGRLNPKACTYTARVRIRVRAGDTLVYRDGSGVGHGSGTTLGEAHESALKEAETDATKRALTTFGNLFGLALYDKEQAGVRRKPKTVGAAVVAAPWILLGAEGEALARHDRPQSFCTDLRQRINRAAGLEELETLWSRQAEALSRLRAEWPELKTVHGLHYAEILGQVYEDQKVRLIEGGRDGVAESRSTWETGDEGSEVAGEESTAVETIADDPSAVAASVTNKGVAIPAKGGDISASATAHDGVAAPTMRSDISVPSRDIDKSTLPLGAPKRLRDREHLLFVGSLPCLVCGRSPAHAHHLRFAQPRAMGSKVSDEWTVPLCPIHHRSLHDMGVEAEWWQAKGIDAKGEAETLWRQRHRNPAVAGGVTVAPDGAAMREGNSPAPDLANPAPTSPPMDEQNQPLPINLHADMPRLR